jgi:hypothetical protein
MTVIKYTTKDKLEALLDASIKPMSISKQLELNYETVQKFFYNLRQIIELSLIWRLIIKIPFKKSV